MKRMLAEKTVMFWIRMLLRFMAWGVISLMTIYRIVLPVIDREPIVLDTNDGWVYFFSGVVLLAIELIKKIFNLIIQKKLGK